MAPAPHCLRIRAIGALVLALLAAATMGLAQTPSSQPGSQPAATAEPIDYDRPRQLAVLAVPALSESSGLAASRRQDGVLWAHNDSGDRPRIYAIDLAGKSLGTFDVRGALAVDWEDMASFEQAGRPMLLLADTGDNLLHRRRYWLYLLQEPLARPGLRGGTAEAGMSIEFSYEDGPQNCEAVAVDVPGRTIYLLTKVTRGSSRVYALPLPEAPPDAPMRLKAVATLPLKMITALDISPDGRRAVVLTYFTAHQYVRQDGQTWADVFARPGRPIGVPFRRQGETICFGRDGRTLYLTSEQGPSPLWEVAPKAAASRPAASQP